MSVKNEMDIICRALQDDSEYWETWKANIAMAFQDQWQWTINEEGLPCTSDQIHALANKAADNFLKMLTKSPITSGDKEQGRLHEDIRHYLKEASATVEAAYLSNRAQELLKKHFTD